MSPVHELGPQFGSMSWVHNSVPQVGFTSWVHEMGPRVGSMSRVHEFGPREGGVSEIQKGMHNPWLSHAGDILNELFTCIIHNITIKDNYDRKKKIILYLELNWSKLAQKPLCLADARRVKGIESLLQHPYSCSNTHHAGNILNEFGFLLPTLLRISSNYMKTRRGWPR